MKTKLLVSICTFILYQSGFAQASERIQGQVHFDKTAATKVEVINATTKTVTLTDSDGNFTINIEINDVLVFVAKNHEIKELKISVAVLNQGFLKVTLSSKIEELKEVVVQNMPYIKLSKDAKWEQAKLDQYALEKNAKKLKNPGVYDGTIENGMDLMRIGGMIFKLFKKEKEVATDKGPLLAFTEAAKTRCKADFFTETLQLKPRQIDDFLAFCTKDPKADSIASERNELTLMEFMSTKILHYKPD